MEKMVRIVKDHPNVRLYLPESFEWLILKSGLIHESNLSEILEHPEDWIESSEYFSWERYFTALLVKDTHESYLKYAKKQLNPAYLQEKVSSKILSVMKGIDLS